MSKLDELNSRIDEIFVLNEVLRSENNMINTEIKSLYDGARGI